MQPRASQRTFWAKLTESLQRVSGTSHAALQGFQGMVCASKPSAQSHPQGVHLLALKTEWVKNGRFVHRNMNVPVKQTQSGKKAQSNSMKQKYIFQTYIWRDFSEEMKSYAGRIRFQIKPERLLVGAFRDIIPSLFCDRCTN